MAYQKVIVRRRLRPARLHLPDVALWVTLLLASPLLLPPQGARAAMLGTTPFGSLAGVRLQSFEATQLDAAFFAPDLVAPSEASTFSQGTWRMPEALEAPPDRQRDPIVSTPTVPAPTVSAPTGSAPTSVAIPPPPASAPAAHVDATRGTGAWRSPSTRRKDPAPERRWTAVKSFGAKAAGTKSAGTTWTDAKSTVVAVKPADVRHPSAVTWVEMPSVLAPSARPEASQP